MRLRSSRLGICAEKSIAGRGWTSQPARPCSTSSGAPGSFSRAQCACGPSPTEETRQTPVIQTSRRGLTVIFRLVKRRPANQIPASRLARCDDLVDFRDQVAQDEMRLRIYLSRVDVVHPLLERKLDMQLCIKGIA